MGEVLYELDPNLVDPPRLIAEDLGFLNGMDFGPDDSLAVAEVEGVRGIDRVIIMGGTISGYQSFIIISCQNHIQIFIKYNILIGHGQAHCHVGATRAFK